MQQASQILLHLIQRSDLTVEQTIQAAQALYNISPIDGSEREKVIQLLSELEQCASITLDQRLNIIAIPMLERSASYLDKASSVRKLLALPLSEKALSSLQKEWSIRSDKISPKEISFIVELIDQNKLSLDIRDTLYRVLRGSVSQFHKIPLKEL